MTASAAVHLLKDEVFAFPYYVRGDVDKATLPLIRLSVAAGPSAVGQAVRRALVASAAAKKRSEGDGAALLSEMGMRTWRQLEKQSVTLHVTLRGGDIRITRLRVLERPGENEHGLGGHQGADLSASCTDEQLGQALAGLLNGD